MVYTDKAWSGDASKYKDTAAYCAACLLDDNPSGQDKKEALCKLPVKEPNGDVNTHALSAAAAALAGARGGLKGVSPADRKKAARTILRYYHGAKLEPPSSLKKLAGGA